MDKNVLSKLADYMDATSVWIPTSVEQQPHVKLIQWRVYSVDGTTDPTKKTIHFNGYVDGEGRVSSPVLEYDENTKRGKTGSGRIYELVGSSGYNRDAVYVFNRWVGLAGAPNVEDVTKQYEKE
jgi:hypothetical protein